jgi:hypothetical protein
MKPWYLFVCTIALLVWHCADSTNNSPTNHQTPGDTDTVLIEMFSAGAKLRDSTTLQVAMPQILSCSGDSVVAVAQQQRNVEVRYRDNAQQLRINLLDMLPLLAGLLNGPSFGDEVTDLLSDSAITTSSATIWIEFLRAEPFDEKIQSWSFSAFNFGLAALLFDDSLSHSIDNAEAVLAASYGDATALSIVLAADSMQLRLVREAYAQATLMGLVDTSASSIRYTRRAPGVWEMTNGKDESLDLLFSAEGDITFSQSSQTHTYYYRPQSCPNDPTVPWIEEWIAAGTQ